MLAPYLHHTLIHFPIVLVLAGAAGLVLGMLVGWQSLLRIGGWSLLAGLLTGIVAAAAGLLSLDEAIGRGVSEVSALEHRNIAVAALALAGLAFAMWVVGRNTSGTGSSRRVSLLSSGLAIAAAGLVSWAAHVGGAMVHPRLQLSRVLGLKEAKPPTPPSTTERRPRLTFDDQVEQGTRVFAAYCSDCHGDSGQGGDLAPALVGANALAKSDNYKSTGELLDFVTNEMPSLDPGSLSTDEYRAVVAWILARNGHEPLLDHNSVKSIDITRGP